MANKRLAGLSASLGLAVLMLVPLFAVFVYLLELRVQARTIERVAVNPTAAARELNGLDKAVGQYAEYLWQSPMLREQLAAAVGGEASLESFYIDKFEVNQQNYRQFLGWLSLQNEELAASFAHPAEPPAYTYKNPNAAHSILGRLEVSVSGISFYAAYAYCKSAGGSLPTIEQWMAAAAGLEGRPYAWGDEFIGDSWRYSDPLLNLAAPLDNRRRNATPRGVFDLGNGLSEWTLNLTAAGRAVQKGGNNYNRPFALQALNFIERPAPLPFSSKYNGFRCVYPAKFSTSETQDRPHFIRMPWQDEAEVVTIPAGTYPLGVSRDSYAPRLMAYLDKSNPQVIRAFLAIPLESQQQAVAFSKYEITRAQYRQFLLDPLARLGFYANNNEPRFHSYIPKHWQDQLAQPELPVTGVDWWSAYAYAKWAGGRLPSENEWLFAFGGNERNPYVWGVDYVPGFSHTRDAQAELFPRTPLAAGAAAHDLTPTGIADLAGNVSEWTNSVAFYDNGVNMIVKGGNYKFPGEIGAHYSYHAKVPPNHRSEVIGIRVVF